MTRKRQAARAFEAWESATRALAHEHARSLAVTITAGTALGPAAYDLGIVLHPDERIWHRCPAVYRWRGLVGWIEQRTSYGGHQSTATEVTVPHMLTTGLTDWLITDQRLTTRTVDGDIVSIYWDAITGLTVDLTAEHVILDGTHDYHGELSGPAIAPIAVAAIAACHGPQSLVEHPALVDLRGASPAAIVSMRTAISH